MTQNCEISCQKISFSTEEKIQYEELKRNIFQYHVRTEELPDGYSFVLKDGINLLHYLADWIPLEHKCCPFLKFTLTMYEDEYIRLNLTGPQEVKNFLLHELNL